MIEPKNIYESNNNINISNEYYSDFNIKKNPFSIYQEQISQRSNYNFDDSNLLLNSINSNLIKNNNSSTNLIYQKKTINSVCKINQNNKSHLSINTNNNNINRDNIGLTLNEYLQEEIKNMKYNHIKQINNKYKIINNNTEETKVNTLDINNNLLNDTSITSYPNYFNTKAKKNQNSNINKKFNKILELKNSKKYSTYKSYIDNNNIKDINNISNIQKNEIIIKKKLNSKGISKYKISKENFDKNNLNKCSFIKNIEFISLNNKNKNNNSIKSQSCLSLNKNFDINSSYRRTKYKELNNSKKILNISFNDKQFKIGIKKENISNYSTINKSNNSCYLTQNKKNKNLSLKNINKSENEFRGGYNSTKNNKKIKIKKIDFLNKSIKQNKNDNNEKQLLNLNEDLDRLIKENNIIKEKANKKFRFCKSIRKNIYKNININDFSKDFFIVPKQYFNSK